MIKKVFLLAVVGMAVVSCDKKSGNSASVSTLKTNDEKASYIIGSNMAQNLKAQGFDKTINWDVFMQGIKDKLEGKKSLFPEDSIQSFMTTYIPDHAEKVKKSNAEEGKKFLEENKKKSGVKTTPSGLQYKVEKEGTGANPTSEDIVSVNYVLKTIDGYVADDSKKINGKPVDIPLNQVVPGWQEGVKLMNKGSKYTLYVPSELAYGENGPVGPNQTLIFEVELVDFKPDSKKDQQAIPQGGIKQMDEEQNKDLNVQSQQPKK
ncbi:FKBP-type peptidyl-prolyl cis-trans isomerase [Apibacter muscae]|uniref:Peptidyl-prolyl cis-trans isomerase n=1 Tax=Apibacter muscae TaxID=2509004 RepID=A0A563DFF8_9FLAO|nr:FKBP-type peptidyl-prolyl cis-trans isomerase [Apibacter muscae]TWP28809.1 FKBP-type peptidyl-prolyl cis-trans isomerase [Apibacter muscae]TWP29940.1 FKBP-type peptidyl-prolyl cis-trans isomerase [Apibacter muscae]